MSLSIQRFVLTLIFFGFLISGFANLYFKFYEHLSLFFIISIIAFVIVVFIPKDRTKKELNN